MKTNFLLLVLLFATKIVSAQPVSSELARVVATNHYRLVSNASGTKSALQELELVNQRHEIIAGENLAMYYVFNCNNEDGFIIVSGDQRVVPVLGYSDNGEFDTNNLPTDLIILLEQYSTEIKHIIADAIPQGKELEKMWTNYETGMISIEKAAVAPMTTTTWSQRPYYNALTPVPTGSSSTPVGCVATAMSQLLKFYNYPASGTNSTSYTTPTYGTLAANFAATTYDWTNMPNSLSSSSTTTAVNAIATLMSQVGISVYMNYTPTGSSAQVSDMALALKNNFGYSSSISHIYRSSSTLPNWITTLKSQLSGGKLVLHAGFCPDPAAGHAFILDGFDASDNFHVNWGWGGSCNGYFQINNLNPGSTYTFNANQSAIINIQPATGIPNVTLNASITSPTSVGAGTPFSFTAGVKNGSTSSFTGKFKADVFDANGEIVKTLFTSSTITLAAGATSTLNFTDVSVNGLPGDYKIAVYISSGTTGKWTIVKKGTYTNPKLIKIASPTNLIKLYQNTNPTVISVVQNTNAVFTVGFKNTGSSAFSGSISADIYNGKGQFKTTIQSHNTTISANGTISLTMNGLVNLTTGTYYIIFRSSTGFSSIYTPISGTSTAVISKIKLNVIESGTSGINQTGEVETTSTSSTTSTGSVNEKDEVNTLVFYPNPTTGLVSLLTENNELETIEVTVWNLAGQLVKTVTVEIPAINQIDLSELPEGVYTVVTLIGEEKKVVQIVKK